MSSDVVSDSEVNSSPIPVRDEGDLLTIATKPHRGHQKRPKYVDDETDDISLWSAAKKQSWAAIDTNPNAFFYRHCAPGEKKRNGAWDAHEKKLFLETMKVHPPSQGKWGLFAQHIPGRVGYQCRNYYHRLLESGEVKALPEEIEKMQRPRKRKGTAKKEKEKKERRQKEKLKMFDDVENDEDIVLPPDEKDSNSEIDDEDAPFSKVEYRVKKERGKKKKNSRKKRKKEEVDVEVEDEVIQSPLVVQNQEIPQQQVENDQNPVENEVKVDVEENVVAADTLNQKNVSDLENEVISYLDLDHHIDTATSEVSSSEIKPLESLVEKEIEVIQIPECPTKLKWTPRMKEPWKTLTSEQIERLKMKNKPRPFQYEASKIQNRNINNPLNLLLFSVPTDPDKTAKYINAVRDHLVNDDQVTKDKLLHDYFVASSSNIGFNDFVNYVIQTAKH